MALRISLQKKLTAWFVAVAVAGAAIAGALVDRNVKQTTTTQYEDRLGYEATMLGQMTANALFGEIDPTDTSLNESVHTLGEVVHTQLAVIALDGTSVADSESADPLKLESSKDAPEITAALATGEGRSIRSGRMYVARSIVRDGKTLGFARSSVPMTEVDAYVRGVRLRMAYGTLAAVLAALVLAVALSSRIVKPVRALAAGAKRVGEGDFAHSIEVASNDEIGDLTTSFNEMTDKLRATVKKLDGRNKDMRLVLDNVNQGLLTLDRDGIVSAERSRVVDRWFGPSEEATPFVKLLERGDAKVASQFAAGWYNFLDGHLPLEACSAQLPRSVKLASRTVELDYTPIGQGGRFEQLLVVVTDVTARVAAERAEAEQREVLAAFQRIMREKTEFLEFFGDATQLVERLVSGKRPSLVDVKRDLHTLKGNASYFGLQSLAGLCHSLEDSMAESHDDLSAADRASLETHWRTFQKRLGELLGERGTQKLEIEDAEYEALLAGLIDGVARADIAKMVAEWKLERVSDRLGRFAEQAKALALRLGKAPIEIVLDCPNVRTPREQLAPFWSAFTHVVRNAVDHGVESPEARVEAGKGMPVLTLSAKRTQEGMVVSLADDGAGINWIKLGEKAQAAGLPWQTERDLIDALFHDGISTRAAVTELSGRGVGMAALRAECDKLGGRIEITSKPGKGTRFDFVLPASVTQRAPLGVIKASAVSLLPARRGAA